MSEELSASQMAQVKEAVQVVLQTGDFLLPNGSSPAEMIAEHQLLFEGHEGLQVGQRSLDRNVGKVLDVVVGPVKVDWRGVAFPSGERDETQGMKAKTEFAEMVAIKMDQHLSNGGVPVKLPAGLKAAIWTAAATVVASGITAGAMLIAANT